MCCHSNGKKKKKKKKTETGVQQEVREGERVSPSKILGCCLLFDAVSMHLSAKAKVQITLPLHTLVSGFAPATRQLIDQQMCQFDCCQS
jgi:hypothetical protein